MSATEKIRIFVNTNLTWSRGKQSAHVAHAALTAYGVHPDIPIVVLGAKPRDITAMRTVMRDNGKTELEPGTLTAGTDFDPAPFVEARIPTVARALHADDRPNTSWEDESVDIQSTYRHKARVALAAFGLPITEGE